MRTVQMTWSILLVTAATLFFSSCKKDDPAVPPNEEEVITTLKLNFVPVGGGPTLVFQFDDADGPGGNVPTQDSIKLATGTVYNVSLQVLNKTTTPVEDITIEVEEEAEAHRFYFEPSASSNVTVAGLDTDANGVALGVNSVWTTAATATDGTVKVTLRHYAATPPNKAAGDAVDSPKSNTDIEVNFISKTQ